MIEGLENLVFGFLASPWLFLVMAAVCLFGGAKMALNKDVENFGCASVLAGFILLGIAAILWRLS